MRKSVIIFSFFLFSCSQATDTIKVQYNDSTGTELLSSPFIEDIEIVTFWGKDAPVLGLWSNIIIKDDRYVLIQSGKTHLYDATGKYLNSVGVKGRGSGEYQDFSDLIIEENGDISVYSGVEGALFTYDSQGRFLKKTEYLYRSMNFCKDNRYNYHYYGHGGGKPYQLYITDNENHTIDSCLASSNVMAIGGAVFSTFGDALNLSPVYGGEVYRLDDGKVSIVYNFDFGSFQLSKAFYQSDWGQSYAYLESNNTALKNRFFENQNYAVLQAVAGNMGEDWARIVIGLLEKATSTWNWFYIKEGDFMDGLCLQYMDDSYIYFAADIESMKEAGLSNRFPVLDTLDPLEVEVVILKCKLVAATDNRSEII